LDDTDSPNNIPLSIKFRNRSELKKRELRSDEIFGFVGKTIRKDERTLASIGRQVHLAGLILFITNRK
jgi:hypothetical protein